MYYGRMAFGYIASILLFINSTIDKDKKKLLLSGLTIILFLVWSNFMMGYIRYALILEVLSGIVMVVLIYQFFYKNTFVRNVLAIMMCGLLIFQVGKSVYSIVFTPTELSWRTTVFQDVAKYKENLKSMFEKYDYTEYLNGVDCFAISDYNSGYAVLLSDNIPIISLLEGYANEYGKQQFEDRIEEYKDKRIFVISTSETIERTIQYLNTTEFKITGEIRSFYTDFLDARTQLILLEITHTDTIENNAIQISKVENEKLTFENLENTKEISFYYGNYPTLCNSGNDGYNVYVDFLDSQNNVLETVLIDQITGSDGMKKVKMELNNSAISSVQIYFKNEGNQTDYNDWLTILNFNKV